MEGVLKISEAANLGLHAMVYLANVQEGRTVSVSQIAESLGVSRDHLGKVLQRLNKLGLVTSHKGPGGGFALERRKGDITLLQIFEAIDGPLVSCDCLLQTPACRKGSCILGDLLRSMFQQVRQHLASRRLSSLTSVYPAVDAARLEVAGLVRPSNS